MEVNPYEPPQVAAELSNHKPWPRVVALLAFPLPWAATFVAWLTYPFMYFQMPLPIVPMGMSFFAMFWCVALTKQLIPANRRFARMVVSAAYIIAIFLAMPIGLEAYTSLGYREPMP